MRDVRFMVISHLNQGPGASRNRGIEESNGKYTAFVDADDWIEKDMYERLYNVAESNEAEVAICNYYLDYANNSSKDIIAFNNTETRCRTNIYNSYIPGPIEKKSGYFSVVNKLYLKEVINKNKITFETNFIRGEDTHFNMNFFICCYKYVTIKQRLYHYVQNPQSIMHKYDPYLIDYILQDYQ